MMEELDELRPPTAWRLLEIWRGTRELAEEPLERALLCNAQVLAESCLRQGKPVFPDGAAVLVGLTAGGMETLLRRLAGGGPPPPAARPAPAAGRRAPPWTGAGISRCAPGAVTTAPSGLITACP